MLSNLSIKNRIMRGFHIVIALNVFMTITGVASLWTSENTLDGFVSGPYEANKAVNTVRLEVNEGAKIVREMYIHAKDKDFSDYIKEVERCVDLILENVSILKSSEIVDKSLITEYEDIITLWIEAADEIMNAIISDNLALAYELFDTKCNAYLAEAIVLANQLNEDIKADQEQMITQITIINVVSMTLLTGLLIACIIASIFLAKKITFSIAHPLRSLEAVAGEMAKGNLQAPNITYEVDDAIGRLSKTIGHSMKVLHSYIADIDRVMSNLSKGNFDCELKENYTGEFENMANSIEIFMRETNTRLAKISLIAQDFTQQSNTIAKNSTDLATGATQQEEIIKAFLEQTEVLSNTVMDNVKQVNNTKNMIGTTRKKAKDGKISMDDMKVAMDGINKSSNNISEVVKTVESIAGQTNLLALNAAIEAARAGESGKGFAVVANEIRDLATKSSEAVKDIEAMIKNSVQEAEKGSEKVDVTSVQFEEIHSSVEDTNTIMGELLKYAQVQKKSVEELNDGTKRLNIVVKSNVNSSEEGAAISQELSAQALELKELIDYFKIK
ncbi:hypothetical protein AN639_05175 [Candidatus Epulonipiscium fishelsonii]|uniref:Uncharacterized protein n=1 Tax=Candidatus Epulonipiscium fishelsonii TaxID=77094 RepID=A0ACC8XA49_9FIRM|nr:hypothetical protein AN396_08070 [Epulopiscium sp. SCG-B11WGA-EpuloA1]ONI40097.1 hypothetical protein AN639_05175 [Epulopiscium sp. SCG-B05WGA-EpuloA1]